MYIASVCPRSFSESIWSRIEGLKERNERQGRRAANTEAAMLPGAPALENKTYSEDVSGPKQPRYVCDFAESKASAMVPAGRVWFRGLV